MNIASTPTAVLGSTDSHEGHEHHEGETHEEVHPGETHSEHEAHEIDPGSVTDHGDHVHEHTGSLWQDYLNLLTDPAHAMVEVTYMLLGEVLIFLIFAPLVKRYFNYRLDKAHAELDREHGIVHKDEPETEPKDRNKKHS